MKNRIFLDTHVVYWLANKEMKRFSKSAQDYLSNNSWLISPMVFLELKYLHEKKVTPHHPHEILDLLKLATDISIDDASFYQISKVAVAIDWTRDAFDRIIVAHAAYHSAILISKDRMIRKNYEKAIW